jgi:hypothetical protein
VFLLLMTLISEVHFSDGLRLHDIRTKFHEDWRCCTNITVLPQHLELCNVGITHGKDL